MHTDPNYVLVMRTCNADMTSYGGFMWPRSGMVECPNWDPRPVCGYGLHGFLWGEGDGGLASWDPDAVWMIVKVRATDIVILDDGDKVKFPRGEVILCRDRLAVTQYMMEHAPGSRAIIGLMATGGYRSTLTGGYRSTLTGGDGSTLTGGHYSTLTGGYCSTLTGGHRSTLTGGEGSTLTGGDRSTLTGGDGSTLTGGEGSTLTGGDGSTLTGGYRSTLTGGDGSTLTGGHYSTLTGGDGSTLTIKHWDGKRCRLVTAYVGEDGILPNVPYRLDENGKFVRA